MRPAGRLQAIFFILTGFVISSLSLLFFNVSPVDGMATILRSGFGSYENLANTLVVATPLIILAVGLSIPFTAKVWNVGAQGQYILGEIFSTWVALRMAPSYPSFLILLTALIFGFIGGMLWAIPPTLMKLYFGTSEIITTLMMNFVAVYLLDYLLVGPMQSKLVGSFNVPTSDQIPRGDMFAHILPGTEASAALFLGLILAAGLYCVLKYSNFGFETKLVGESLDAAKYGGVFVGRIILSSMLISGGVAGIAGMAEVFGSTGVLLPQVFSDITTSFGYVGIPVALIAALNPILIILSAIFFAGILSGAYGLELYYNVPIDVVIVFYGLMMLFSVLALKIDLTKSWLRNSKAKSN